MVVSLTIGEDEFPFINLRYVVIVVGINDFGLLMED